jgi:hypothetical protein
MSASKEAANYSSDRAAISGKWRKQPTTSKNKSPNGRQVLGLACFFIFFRSLLALMNWHGICNAYRSSFAGNIAVRIINPLSLTRRTL